MSDELVTVEKKEQHPILSLVRPTNNAASVAIEAHRAAVETVAQVMSAQALPRDNAAIKEAFLEKAKDPIFADKCVSFKPVGDGIYSPSVYMATYMDANYPHFKVRTIDHGGDDTYSQVEGIVWDIQNNTFLSMTSTVKHKKKVGQQIVAVTDPAEYRNLVKAEESKTVRNAILKHLPPDLVDELFEACQATLDIAAVEFLKDKTAVVKFFTEQFQITPAQLYPWLRIKGPQDLEEKHIRRMKAFGRAIKDGDVNPAELFKGAKDIPTKEAKAKGKATVAPPDTTSDTTTTETKGDEKPNETKTTEKTGAKDKGKGGAKNKGASGAAPDSSKDKEGDKVAPEPEGGSDSTPEASGLDEGESESEGADDDSADGDDGDGDGDSGDLPSAVGAPSDEKKAAIKQMFE